MWFLSHFTSTVPIHKALLNTDLKVLFVIVYLFHLDIRNFLFNYVPT